MAELCKSCVHQKVCMKDKNLVGDVFVPGNPRLFDNAKLFAQYEERKKAGFPCDDYLSADVAPVRRGRWVETEQPMGWRDVTCAECSECGEDFVLDELGMDDVKNLMRYCPNCGARMEGET